MPRELLDSNYHTMLHIRNSKLLSVLRKLFFFCAVLLFLLNSLYYYQRTCDDAFISFRYARNMAYGKGLVYNSGERVEGYSNLLWVLILAGVVRMGGDPVIISKVLGIISGVGVMLLSVLLFKKLEQKAFPFISIGFLGTSSFFAYWAVSGMETSFFSFLLLASVLRLLYESNPNFRPFSAVLFLLASLTRPEGVLYLGVFLFVFYRTRPSKSYIKKWFTIFTPSYAAFLMFRFLYYGRWLPNTYTAKIGFRAFLFPKGSFLYLGNFLNIYNLSFSSFSILLISGIIFFIVFHDSKDLLILSTLTTWCVFYFVTGGDWMPNYRFIVPIFPFIFIALECGLIRFNRKLKKNVSVLFGIVITVCFFLSAAHAFSIDTSSMNHLLPGGKISKKPYFRSVNRTLIYWFYEVPYNAFNGLKSIELKNTSYILENFYPTDSIIFSDIGFVGYITGNPIIDMYGLVTQSTAQIIYSSLLNDGKREKEYSKIFIGEVKKKKPSALFIYITLEGKKRLDEMVFEKLYKTKYFSEEWELKKKIVKRKGKVNLLIFERKGVQHPSYHEVIDRYKELRTRFPHFPYIKERLKKLRSKPGSIWIR